VPISTDISKTKAYLTTNHKYLKFEKHNGHKLSFNYFILVENQGKENCSWANLE